MPKMSLPAGRYLTCGVDVRPDYGGQTRALLIRNRIFARDAGIRPWILTFGAAPDYDERRRILLERGLLLPESSLLNIYEHYREHDWATGGSEGEEPDDLAGYLAGQETHLDASPWRRTYRLPGSGVVHDYLRPDGTAFLRIPGFVFKDPATWPTRIQQIDKTGVVSGTFTSLGQWFRQWVRELTRDDDRAFVFIDSRYVVPHLVPMKAPHVHLIYIMHNAHVLRPRRWDSPTTEEYRRVLDHIGGMDAMVTLTSRQGDDIARRRGRTSNLFVVPNPVEIPAEPPNTSRDAHLVTIVARLEAQKRLDHAISAFDLVVKEIPDAHLDIYGSGSRMQHLQREIDKRGLNRSVTLKGRDIHAADAFWRSRASLMTSSFEGWGLTILESMSRGCPVVSYDVKYGPREQVTDCVDGFLVEDGNIEQVAERTIRLLRDSDLMQRMSDAARRKAIQHGSDRFVSDWEQVLRSVIDLKPSRTLIREASVDVRRFGIRSRRAVLRRATPTLSQAPERVESRAMLELAGVVRVKGRGVGGLRDAQVELLAVHHVSGRTVRLPLELHRMKRAIRISTTFALATAYPPELEGPERTHLLLRLTWRNSSWETVVARPAPDAPGIEVGYDVDNTLQLTRFR